MNVRHHELYRESFSMLASRSHLTVSTPKPSSALFSVRPQPVPIIHSLHSTTKVLSFAQNWFSALLTLNPVPPLVCAPHSTSFCIYVLPFTGFYLFGVNNRLFLCHLYYPETTVVVDSHHSPKDNISYRCGNYETEAWRRILAQRNKFTRGKAEV